MCREEFCSFFSRCDLAGFLVLRTKNLSLWLFIDDGGNEKKGLRFLKKLDRNGNNIFVDKRQELNPSILSCN
jgi:hypothetical protein